MFYEVYVATESRFRSFEYDGVSYRRVAPHGTVQTKLINGARVVSVEQAVIDSIRDFEKIAGLEETLRCIRLIPSLDPERAALRARHERERLSVSENRLYPRSAE